MVPSDSDARQRKKLAILVNVVAPYRVPLYREIGSHFETSIHYSGKEHNRASWSGGEDALRGMTVRRSSTLTFPYRTGGWGEVYDYKFLHIPLGHLRELVHIRPDGVIANEMGFRTMVALAYGALFRKPVWVWWGGTLHTERRIGAARKFVRKMISRRVPRWISYGETSTEYLRALGVPRERILQIQNCVDEKLYLARSEPAVRLKQRPVFLYVGQFIRRKGVDRLLQAAARLQREGRQFSLLLVGGGPERRVYERMADELGLENVFFHDVQPPEAMPALYRSADFLVFPTYEDVWGLVVNEALWSGVPVLSSVHAGCAAELLPPEQLFDPLDLTGFVDVWRRALDGAVGAPDRAVLKSCAEVAEAIVADLREALHEVDA